MQSSQNKNWHKKGKNALLVQIFKIELIHQYDKTILESMC